MGINFSRIRDIITGVILGFYGIIRFIEYIMYRLGKIEKISEIGNF